MALSLHDIELIDKYLDGHASSEELAELDRRLKDEPRLADILAAVGRMDAWLAEHFRVEKGVRDVAAVFQEIETGRPAAGRPQNAVTHWRPRRQWFAAAAAIIAVCAGLGLWLYLGGASEMFNEVLDGRVLADGTEATRIPDGATISVVGPAAAAIRLTDGSRATFEPSSEAVLHGRAGGRQQLVELVAGGGAFQVARNVGGFEVKTALGSVTALGTEFSVRLLPSGGRERNADPAGPDQTVLAVAVQSGSVQVEFAGQTYVLREGQDRTFAHEGKRWPKEITISGEVTKVEADSIAILSKGGDTRPDQTKRVTVDSTAKVLIETDQMESVPGEGGKMKDRPKTAEGSLSDLKVGQRVTVTCTEDAAKALKVLVLRTAPPKPSREGEGKAPAPSPPRESRERN